MMQNEITQYIDELNRQYREENATEHTYRPALQRLLENVVETLRVEARNDVPFPQIINEPRRIACGAPDYIVMRGEVPVGYIETKIIGTDLNGRQHKAQFDRYKQSLNNLIITDYVTFQLFVNGLPDVSVSIAKINPTGIDADKTQFDKFIALVQAFIGYDGQTIKSSLSLSKVMAAKARLMAYIIENALVDDVKHRDASRHISTISGQLLGFRQALIPNITEKEFSDIYAQTIAYGMFAACLNDKTTDTFTRIKAAQLIPQSNPFLRKLFQYIAGYDLDNRIRWIVDDLAVLFNYVDIPSIIREFDKSEQDPIVHFYETFLSEYDSTLRKSRGVWYTPQAVVKFIVQAVDDILKTEFGILQGLADSSMKKSVKYDYLQDDGSIKTGEKDFHRVQILDPATGTGTFLAEVVQSIYRRFRSQKGMWQSYVDKHLIPRINGFEILMASYAMAHLKLDMVLQQTGYRHTSNKRLNIFLTNSLTKGREKTQTPFVQWLSNEANEASFIKQIVPVMVVLGNPPYSGESRNCDKWIIDLIAQYKKEPHNPSKNIPDTKWINNDYVKFIRLGQHFIEKNSEGILAYITDNSFLDSLSFRGMRYNLMQTFDKIFILNLHGNSQKKETAPDGSKDENVFDIQQGVSINIFIKTNTTRHCGIDPQSHFANVFYYDLFGKRQEKYNFLLDNDLQTLEWKELQPQAPNYFFVPKDFSLKDEYEKGVSVQELFKVSVLGFQSHRDNFAIDFDRSTICKRVTDLISKQFTNKELFEKYKIKNNRDWNLTDSRRKVRTDLDWENKIINCGYRPFDNRPCYFSYITMDYPRKELLQHVMNKDNLCLNIVRQTKMDSWKQILVSDIPTSALFVEIKDGSTVFPLYLYVEGDVVDGWRMPDKKTSNLNETIIAEISQRTGLQFVEESVETDNSPSLQNKTFAPIDVLDYIYAALHSPTYRERYKEFLKIDFPRVPYPQDAAQFWTLVELGGKLRRLHLMENVDPQEGMADFPITGSNEVGTICYAEPSPCHAAPLPRHSALDAESPMNNEIAGHVSTSSTTRNDDSGRRNDGRVFINATQYFENVPLDSWDFYIGGYQPAQKWLKDRKGRTLSYDDLRHYQKIIRILKETEEVMREVDSVMVEK